MIAWKNIIIHHSVTPIEFPVDGIRQYHIAQRGYKDIAYHYLIKKLGSAYEVVVGRPINMAGAHCIGRNSDSIGICVVGNYEEEAPEQRAMVTLISFCASLCDQHKIPFEHIYPHNHFAKTACPGKHIDVERIRCAVASELS